MNLPKGSAHASLPMLRFRRKTHQMKEIIKGKKTTICEIIRVALILPVRKRPLYLGLGMSPP